MRKIVAFIPNLFTLGNLFCGCLGIIYAFNGRLDACFYMVLIAAFLDFFDGFFARILKVDGELGKQLDSLADAISFGVLPAIAMFIFLDKIIDTVSLPCFSLDDFKSGELLVNPVSSTDCFFELNPISYHPLSFTMLFIALFSIYRLAKFNIDTRQSHGFIGLPTPANALFITSYIFTFLFLLGKYSLNFYFNEIRGWTIYPPLGYIPDYLAYSFNGTTYEEYFTLNWFIQLIYHPFTIVIIGITFSFLLVSPLPLFALKFKNFGWNENKIRYIFLGISLALLILFQVLAIPFIVILYILISIVNNIFKITV